jgi:hypothetical protein
MSLLGGTLAIVLLLLFVIWLRSQPRTESDPGDDFVADPRLTFDTPFRNVRPEVQYVGDGACAGCHPVESKGFHQHPMGRSLMPIAAVAPTQRYEPALHNPFEVSGIRYEIERQGDRVRHKEIWPDAKGEPLLVAQNDMVYAIGSGAQTVSYLFTRGDYLFESPITWYVREERWNLSPGYEWFGDRFGRPASEQCLFCHSNPVEIVKGTVHRYAQPLFPYGSAIGCERCHGPGQLHVDERVARRDVPDAVDYSIVNPRHLPPNLREAVCYQCHLEGERRIVRRGRQPFDYRPGLPLELFWAIFLPAPDVNDHGKFVGQVEQLRASQCFAHSDNRLGCSTCHDPHEQPAVADRPAWYRGRCLECHKDQSCALAPAERRDKNGDSCIACHMPRLQSAEIVHTASTDHRIVRRPLPPPARPAPRRLQLGEVPLVDCFRSRLAAPEAEEGRDVGLALVDLAHMPSPLVPQLGATALPYLEAALRRGPRDLPALEGCAFCLGTQQRYHEALELAETILARAPQRETTLVDAAVYAAMDGQREKSLEYWRRAVAVDPWRSDCRLRFIEALHSHGDYEEAIAQCHEALAFSPGVVPIRKLLVSSYLASGRRDKAQAEFETLCQVNPRNSEELRRWYEEQRRH